MGVLESDSLQTWALLLSGSLNSGNLFDLRASVSSSEICTNNSSPLLVVLWRQVRAQMWSWPQGLAQVTAQSALALQWCEWRRQQPPEQLQSKIPVSLTPEPMAWTPIFWGFLSPVCPMHASYPELLVSTRPVMLLALKTDVLIDWIQTTATL